MSSEDFASNNNNPTSSVPGRGQGARVVTAGIGPHSKLSLFSCANADMKNRRKTPGNAIPSMPQSTPQAVAPGAHLVHLQNPDSALLQNQYHGATGLLQPGSSPTNPFHAGSGQASTAAQDWLFAQFRADPHFLAQLQDMVGPMPGFSEDQDEMFADPQADMVDGSDDHGPSISSGAGDLPISMLTLPLVPPTSNSLETPPNHRVFPSATANMSSTYIEINPPRPVTRRAAKATYSDFSSPSTRDLHTPACHERIYGARKDFKECARLAAKGADGFGFVSCSAQASNEEQDRIATANRKLVATLTEKSAFVFSNTHDRTIKGSMYQHPSIAVVVGGVLYKNLLSMGMQFTQYFDDTSPEIPHDAQNHKPTLSLVTIALAITAIRAAIMDHSWRGTVRTVPASFLTRTLQEKLSEARNNLLKDVVAPVSPPEVMDDMDFAQNQ
ncbi:hypothetical protein R3P38DRAFT_3175288 [Favolaschia claudopus]|uniref:DUF6532 domain-containing protein n=1 Tax=Favolaschia claudopus TaxID=2862362 RepID=A0AAW0DCX9_9AGAR